ncbi:hypothetical protein EYF80_016174 [Liparis tanakae]|uniref:Uncharacterized protein n=1 Tax=Liparis tanakae TaxID=230148 RepID=A0A4Z2I697_9TELE|nr:hypothetical protein EYF80_016174 [Liparis tanakae]
MAPSGVTDTERRGWPPQDLPHVPEANCCWPLETKRERELEREKFQDIAVHYIKSKEQVDHPLVKDKRSAASSHLQWDDTAKGLFLTDSSVSRLKNSATNVPTSRRPLQRHGGGRGGGDEQGSQLDENSGGKNGQNLQPVEPGEEKER